ncbi:MAG: MFS transporter [Deltaproteobacteria bacterium]|uniref:MFS transporter n=1 Tax=Candidatus Zymogenus saltonus TaxID=2844893 RepID=A0A9D8PRG1_9DELT|nr:MFS transporter [Candidatus Zymogenus saltonus]
MTQNEYENNAEDHRIVKLIPLFVAISVLGLTLGLTLPVLSLAMDRVGASVTLIGLNTLFANLAALITASLTPVVITKVGGKRLIAWGLIFAGLTLTLFAFSTDIPSFFVFRIANGFSFGFIFVATETFVISMSSPERRARNMGIYGMAMATGGAFGPAIGFTLFEKSPGLPFLTGGAICLVSIIIFLLLFRPTETLKQSPKGVLSPAKIAIPLGAAVAFGFILEGVSALIPLYLKEIKFPPKSMGYIVTAFQLGAIPLQYPLCFIADKFGKRRYLATIYILIGIGFFTIPLFSAMKIFLVLSFLIGGAISSIHPVGMAIAGDDVKKDEYSQAAAYMSIGFSMGAIFGPYILSLAMDTFGYEYLFYTSGTVLVLLSLQPIVSVLNRS